MASATVPTSIGDKLLASAVPAPAFRSTIGAATNAKAESTQTIVYRGSRSGGNCGCLQRCYVHTWFATDVDAQTDYTDNTPASQPTPASTSARALQETPQPTTKVIPGATIISDIAQFVAMYGQPNNHSVPSAGYYHFRRYASSNLDFLIVQADAADGGIYAQRVKGVMAQAPGAGWNQQEASATCTAFLPRDAISERAVKLANGYDKVYFSAALAGLFPASAFTDPNGSQVKARLLDVQYI